MLFLLHEKIEKFLKLNSPIGLVSNQSKISADFCYLFKRLKQLRSNLLPSNFDPTGNYSDAEYDRTRGFIILTHAEIEHFIENRCSDTIVSCQKKLFNHRTPSQALFALHVICFSDWNGLIKNKSLPNINSKKNVNDRIFSCIQQYNQILKDNNGIKINDLKKMLTPLSIRLEDLDDQWIDAMDTFGSQRGEVAHTSMGRVLKQPDPKEVWITVRYNLLPGLKRLDKLLSLLT